MSDATSFTGLRELGFSVFPLQPRDKKPTGSWKEYQTVPATLAQCTAWDKPPYRYSRYNIAIVTGEISDCFVLDIDGELGAQTLAELVAKHGELPRTPTVKTGKGKHYYFKFPSGYKMRNLAGKAVDGTVLPGIDQRSDGGYVVAPPSIHPNGATYEWIVSPLETPMADAPEWLLALVAVKDTPEPVLDYNGTQDVPLASSYLQKALAGELDKLRVATVGRRNDALNKAAFSLGQLISAGLDEHRIANELTAAARGLGLQDAEIAITIQSGLEGGKTNPRQNIGQRPVTIGMDDEQSSLIASDHVRLALAVIATFGMGNLIYAINHFWHWDGSGVWTRLDEHEVRKVIHRVASTNPAVSKNFVVSVLYITETEASIQNSLFDCHDDMVINCQSGELHLVDGQWVLKPARRESYMTVQLPVKHDASADAPRFRQFLQEIFAGDADARQKEQALLEMIGYSMLRSCAFERFIILIGAGANGKSVALKVLTALLGYKSVTAVCPSQFENRFQRAHLHGKLANIISELSEGGELADATLKAVVSGEIITAEHKHKPPFEFRPYCTCWFGTNHMPQTRDFSDAIYRRAIVLAFNRKFEGATCDPYLSDKLIAELSGIFNMALDAIAGVIARKAFTDPPSSIEAKQHWRMESDQVAQFMEECCELYKDYESSSHEIYARYQQWAKEAGSARPLNRKNFTGRLKRFGVEPYKGSGGRRMLHGIRLTISYAGEPA